jgi:hypothetical protein
MTSDVDCGFRPIDFAGNGRLADAMDRKVLTPTVLHITLRGIATGYAMLGIDHMAIGINRRTLTQT